MIIFEAIIVHPRLHEAKLIIQQKLTILQKMTICTYVRTEYISWNGRTNKSRTYVHTDFCVCMHMYGDGRSKEGDFGDECRCSY